MPDKTENILMPFDELKATLAEAKEKNDTLVFNYTDPQGNKDARSHVASLRKIKAQITKVHKIVKADVLETGRAIDAKKNEYLTEIEAMIEVHAAPIKEIEDHEKAVLEEQRLAEVAKREAEEQARIAAVQKQQEDLAERERVIAEQETKIAEEKEQLAQKTLEQQIAEKAAERTRQDERDKIAQEAAREAEEEQKRKDEEARLAAIEAQKEKDRVENEEHRKAVNSLVASDFMDYGMLEENARALAEKIGKGEYSRLTINY